jgi:hypothetical protein
MFAEEYATLSPGEQAQFAEAVRVLLAEGLIWREDSGKRHIYSFLNRHTDLVKDYLSIAGWQLLHHEQSMTFQVVHRDGYHRRRLNLDTTIWLLLLRMLYAEQQESNATRLTRYPVVTIGEIIRRYSEFPHARKRKKTSLEDALRQLQQLNLIRAANGGSLRVSNPQQLIELLPTLEVVVPRGSVQQVAEQLSEYFDKGDPASGADAAEMEEMSMESELAEVE